ncbi:hypothetical protein AAFC00_005878 [Neodothiora populina]|uniref:Zn(2)-C6 fungal-type domain-containing protein n=1 Tax=Neodothiora populina TaxID=2781224 RepID=A0ABR3P6U3_9PEZI
MAEGASKPLQDPTAVTDTTDTGVEGRDKPRQIRRRNRVIASCLPCRQRKVRCDKLSPCSNCRKFSRSCLYIAPALDTVAQQELAELKDKLSNLEESLGRDVIRRAARARAPHGAESSGQVSDDGDDGEDTPHGPDDEKDLEPTPLAVFDQLYEEDADDELMDLGVAMGKLRITERIGGLVRPKMAEELHAHLKQQDRGQSQAKRTPVFRQQYGGYTSQSGVWQPDPMLPETYLAPGPDFIAPSSSFFFPEMANSPAELFLPFRNCSDQLVAQYMLAVHPIARTVHRPTFEKQYNVFWDCFNQGSTPPAPLQALIFAAMFSAAVSSTDVTAMQMTGMPKTMLVEQLRVATEASLARAHFLQTTKLDTLQAFVMYMIPLCHNEVSRAQSALVGLAIRLAQCNGLHRDGSLYGLSALDTHVRRLVWHQLCFLDIRTAESTGPRPQIRRDEFDTKLPLNVNEDDFLASSPPTEDSPVWTDMTLPRMKVEIYDLIRQLWDDMQRMDRKKTTLTSTLGKIQDFRSKVGVKYMALVRENTPMHLLTRQIYRGLSNRSFVIILQRYAQGTTNPMPERLKQMLVETALACTESGIALDTHPELKAWAWYRPAMLPYHACLLLLLEVYNRPDMKEASRIWACADYVFELIPELNPKEKAEGVLMELRDRLGVYQNFRKVKASTNIDGQTPRGSGLSPAVSRTNSEASNLTFPNMQMFSTPSHVPNYNSPNSDHSGSRGGNNYTQDMPSDVAIQPVADIDWNEWEKHFPNEGMSHSVLGGADLLADFEMASFNPHTSYTMIASKHISR